MLLSIHLEEFFFFFEPHPTILHFYFFFVWSIKYIFVVPLTKATYQSCSGVYHNWQSYGWINKSALRLNPLSIQSILCIRGTTPFHALLASLLVVSYMALLFLLVPWRNHIIRGENNAIVLERPKIRTNRSVGISVRIEKMTFSIHFSDPPIRTGIYSCLLLA